MLFINDSLGLVWSVLVYAAHQTGGVITQKVIDSLQDTYIG